MDSIREITKKELNEELISLKRCSGGSINDVYECSTKSVRFVIKINDIKQYPHMFEKEEQGLALLNSSKFRIPNVLNIGAYENISYLILEYIDDKGNTINEAAFGSKLAEMHLLSSKKFGLDHDNYIGSIPQKNQSRLTWCDYYQSMRLEPLIKQSFDKGLLNKNTLHSFDKLYLELEQHIPIETPSLLHGDLWQGNIICDENSMPVLIDPAVYYGHREIDLAMLLLFGDISEQTIDAYNSKYPLEHYWRNRMDMHQLYPLLVHLILFGNSYFGAINNVLRKYT